MSLNFGQGLFPQRGEAMASYDYYDIASSTGVVAFYLMTDIVATTGLLTEDNTINLGTSADYLNGGFTESSGTITFDTNEFQSPRRIKGKPIFNYALGINGGSSITVTAVKLVQVHVGGTTTDLTTATGNLATLSDATDRNIGFIHQFTEVNKLIKKGEKIRISLSTNAANNTAFLTNPANTQIIYGSGGNTANITKSTIYIPFRIEI